MKKKKKLSPAQPFSLCLSLSLSVRVHIPSNPSCRPSIQHRKDKKNNGPLPLHARPDRRGHPGPERGRLGRARRVVRPPPAAVRGDAQRRRRGHGQGPGEADWRRQGGECRVGRALCGRAALNRTKGGGGAARAGRWKERAPRSSPVPLPPFSRARHLLADMALVSEPARGDGRGQQRGGRGPIWPAAKREGEQNSTRP